MVFAKPEDDPKFRELCERASREKDHEMLMQLVKQINERLQERQQPQRPGEAGESTKQSREGNASGSM
jgi:hypothetical protein